MIHLKSHSATNVILLNTEVHTSNTTLMFATSQGQEVKGQVLRRTVGCHFFEQVPTYCQLKATSGCSIGKNIT